MFHSSNQTNSLVVEPRVTSCWNSVVTCFASNSFACKWNVAGERWAWLVLLRWQVGVQICELLCISFLCQDRWCYSFGIAYPSGLSGINRCSQKFVCEAGIGKSMSKAAHGPISTFHTVGVFARAFQERVAVLAGQVRLRSLSAATVGLCKTNLLSMCIFGWSSTKQSGPFYRVVKNTFCRND